MRRVVSSVVLLLVLMVSTAAPVGAVRATAISVQIVVAGTRVASGTPLHVVVLVFNGAAYAIKTRTCSEKGLVEVDLTGAHSSGAPFTTEPSCRRKYRLPTGLTRLAISVPTTYAACGPGTRACSADHKPPPLPPGVYRAETLNVGLPKGVPGAVSKPLTLTP